MEMVGAIIIDTTLRSRSKVRYQHLCSILYTGVWVYPYTMVYVEAILPLTLIQT